MGDVDVSSEKNSGNGQERRRTNNTSSTITNLIVLRLGELHEKLCDRMFDLHLTQNSGTIVRDGDLSVWGNQDFVQA